VAVFADCSAFAAAEYLGSIGYRMESFWPQELRPKDSASTPEEARLYALRVMQQAIDLRDSESKKQQRELLTQAIAFIDEHYPEESISLDRVPKK
jgi:hypothetical protein